MFSSCSELHSRTKSTGCPYKVHPQFVETRTKSTARRCALLITLPYKVHRLTRYKRKVFLLVGKSSLMGIIEPILGQVLAYLGVLKSRF